MTTWRLAWRNLWRNRRRTELALAAIGLSVALVLVYDGVLRGYGDWLRETITGPMLGHVQIHAPEWRKTRAMERTIPHAAEAVAALIARPDVAGATARIYAPAIIARSEEGVTAFVLGLDGSVESRPGRLLAGSAIRPSHGHVLMGRPLADQMGVRPGAVIAVVGQAADGSVANDLFTVAGVVETSVDFVNRQAVIMEIADAQALYAMPDEAHEIVVYARDAADVTALSARLAALPPLAGLEVLDWQTLAPEMVSLVQIVEVAWLLILVLVFAAAAAGVANTMLMATFERTHEFGMLLALGTRPLRIVAMIGVESVALGVLGAAMGGVVGVMLVALAHRTGVDYAALTGGGPSQISVFGLNWSLRLYPSLAAIDVVRVVAAVVVTSLLASIWPASRAARLQPAQALSA